MPKSSGSPRLIPGVAPAFPGGEELDGAEATERLDAVLDEFLGLVETEAEHKRRTGNRFLDELLQRADEWLNK